MIDSGEYLIDCGEICDRLSLPLFNFIWNHREDFDTDKLVGMYNRLHRWDMKTLHLDMAPKGYKGPAMLFELSLRSSSMTMAKLVYQPDLQQGEFSHYWGDSTPDDAVLGMRMSWLNTLVRLTGCLELMIHKKVEW